MMVKSFYATGFEAKLILEYRVVGRPPAWPFPGLEVLVLVQNDLLDLGLTSLVDQLGWILSALLLRSYVVVIKTI